MENYREYKREEDKMLKRIKKANHDAVVVVGITFFEDRMQTKLYALNAKNIPSLLRSAADMADQSTNQAGEMTLESLAAMLGKNKPN